MANASRDQQNAAHVPVFMFQGFDGKWYSPTDAEVEYQMFGARSYDDSTDTSSGKMGAFFLTKYDAELCSTNCYHTKRNAVLKYIDEIQRKAQRSGDGTALKRARLLYMGVYTNNVQTFDNEPCMSPGATRIVVSGGILIFVTGLIMLGLLISLCCEIDFGTFAVILLIVLSFHGLGWYLRCYAYPMRESMIEYQSCLCIRVREYIKVGGAKFVDRSLDDNAMRWLLANGCIREVAAPSVIGAGWHGPKMNGVHIQHGLYEGSPEDKECKRNVSGMLAECDWYRPQGGVPTHLPMTGQPLMTGQYHLQPYQQHQQGYGSLA